MALTRRSVQRMSGSIWPGFVDAMTALLLVLMFVLTIFMIVQGMLRETISGQESELDQLTGEVTALSQALGLAQQRTVQLEDNLSAAQDESTRQAALIASLTGQIDTQNRALAERDAAIASFEDQVALLLSERDAAIAEGATLAASIEDLEAAQAQLITEQEAMQLALAQARTEIDAQTEAARLAAAQREALEAMTADLEAQTEGLQDQLSEAEQARLAEIAVAEALRERLENSDAELTAMSLALEERRREAEETLTLLAAANAIEDDLDARLADALIRIQTAENLLAQNEGQNADLSLQVAQLLTERDALRAQVDGLQSATTETSSLREQLAAALAAKISAESQLSESQQNGALLSVAQEQLAEEQAISAQAQREMAVLNEQIASLRGELDVLQGILDASADADNASQVRIEALGSQLNQALARAAAEEQKRAELEAAEAERLRLEAERLNNEVTDLAEYRSEFFGTLRQVLGDREGVQIVGDRFVFSSEVLFESASATLSPAGQAQIAQVAGILSDVSDQIPDQIDWIIRVDGHTDNIPLSGTGAFTDNWELSQGRALSVVKYLTDVLGFPPQRLAATGFGEFRPVNTADTSAARAQNRRIELKLTER